jgi:hypothetical protein
VSSSSAHRPPGRRGWPAGIGPRVAALLQEDGGRFLSASLGAAVLAVVLRPRRSGVRLLKVGAGGSGVPLTISGVGSARRLPQPLGEVRSAVVALASVVRGRSQFSAAAPVAGDVASSGLVGELPLVVDSMRSTRTASSSVVDARRLALSALLDGYRLKVMVVVGDDGSGPRMVLQYV